VLLAAAAAAVVAIGVTAVVTLNRPESDSSASSAAEPQRTVAAASTGAPNATDAQASPGPNGGAAAPQAPAATSRLQAPSTSTADLPEYRRATLPAQVTALLAQSGKQTATAPQTSGGGTATTDRPPPSACVVRIVGSDRPPTASTVARFEGRPAQVLVYANPGGRTARVVIVDVSCAGPDALAPADPRAYLDTTVPIG
jgi:hypothetical protein